MKEIAQNLHLLLCKKSHMGEDTDCHWYTESQRAEQWDLPSHKMWLTKTEKIISMSGIEEGKFDLIIRRLFEIVSSLTYLKENNPTVSEVIDTIVIEASKPRKIIPVPEQTEADFDKQIVSPLPDDQ